MCLSLSPLSSQFLPPLPPFQTSALPTNSDWGTVYIPPHPPLINSSMGIKSNTTIHIKYDGPSSRQNGQIKPWGMSYLNKLEKIMSFSVMYIYNDFFLNWQYNNMTQRKKKHVKSCFGCKYNRLCREIYRTTWSWNTISVLTLVHNKKR